MKWYEIIINLIIGILSGVISAYLSNLFFEKRYDKKEKYNNNLLLSYLFFEKLETNMSGFDSEYINNQLVVIRELYSKDKELADAFNKIDISLTNMIKINLNGGISSFNFNSEDYLIFKEILNRKLKR